MRIVEELEQRYPGFPGLNLTWEVRESLAFHSKRPGSPEILPYRQGVFQPTLEAQVVDAADSIVYDIHDLDDAFGVKLISLEDVRALQFWQNAEQSLTSQHGAIPENRLVPTVLRYLLSWRERELLHATQLNLKESGIQNVMDAKLRLEPLVQEGSALEAVIQQLRTFLLEKVYKHIDVIRMSERGKIIVNGLFECYCANPSQMPSYYQDRAGKIDINTAVSDYIAGMTDRLAALEYKRLFQSREKSDMIETLS